MSNEREIRQKCDMCDRIMMWNVVNRCEECRIRESSDDVNEENEEIGNEVNIVRRENRSVEVRSRRRQRCGEIKVKGGVTEIKNKGITRLFSVNCNGFGPGSNDKIDQVIRESKRRNIDGAMISSSDTRWGTVNKSIIENKLKSITSKICHQIARRH